MTRKKLNKGEFYIGTYVTDKGLDYQTPKGYVARRDIYGVKAVPILKFKGKRLDPR